MGKKPQRAPLFIVLLCVAIFIAVAAFFISDVENEEAIVQIDQGLVESSPPIIVEEEVVISQPAETTTQQDASQSTASGQQSSQEIVEQGASQ